MKPELPLNQKNRTLEIRAAIVFIEGRIGDFSQLVIAISLQNIEVCINFFEVLHQNITLIYLNYM